MLQNTYFQAPNFSTAPPPDGPLQLGHIILCHKAPELDPLNEEGYLAPPAAKIYPTDIKAGFVAERHKLKNGELGIWAQIMASFGLQASISHERSSDDVVHVEELHTTAFHPTVKFVQESIENSPDVGDFLQTNKNKSTLYMISGLKIAKGASVEEKHSNTTAGAVQASLPIEGADIGPKIKASSTNAQSQGFARSSTDFILGFRVHRIVFKKGVLQRPEIETRGAKMHDSQQTYDAVDEVPEVEDISEHIEVDNPAWQVVDGDEDNEKIICFEE